MKITRIIFLLIAVILMNQSCQKNETNTFTATESSEPKPNYVEYSKEDAFVSEELSREAYPQTARSIPVFPVVDSVYSGTGGESGWVRCYIDENGALKTGSMCRDPLCAHRSDTCPAYMARSSSGLFEANGKLYFFSMIDKGKAYGLIEYDPAALTVNIVSRMDNNGIFIGRVGRFLFFYIKPEIGQKDNGQVLTETRLYRYDILKDKTEYLGKSPNMREFIFSEGYSGYIYYFGPGKMVLYRRDVNMKNEEKIVSPGKQMLTYEINGDNVYYLVREEDGQNGWGYGTLYRYDMISEKTEALYHDVTWFTLDNDTIYYTLYDPIPNFDWDIVTTDGEGKKKTETQTIYSMNGNTVYRIGVDQAGKRGERVPGIEKTMENGEYIGEWYRAYKDYLIVQLKKAYKKDGKNGMYTGYAAVHMESGEVAYFWTDIVFNR